LPGLLGKVGEHESVIRHRESENVILLLHQNHPEIDPTRLLVLSDIYSRLYLIVYFFDTSKHVSNVDRLELKQQ